MRGEEFRVGDLTEVRGKWWNPLSKERVAPGTLTLSDDEPVLTYDYRSHGSEGDRIVLDDTVHGLLDDGRAVTLWDWRVGEPKSTMCVLSSFSRPCCRVFSGQLVIA